MGTRAVGTAERTWRVLAPTAVALACLCLGLAAAALPVALVRVPPLLDYPNHFARVWLISGGVERPHLSAIYAVDWSAASTNIGIDLLAATVGRAIGGEALMPLLVAAALVLPPLGAALLNRAVFGGWHWWQAGFALFAWNGTLVMGFLNFQIGLGLALLAAAADPAIARRPGAPGRFALRAGACGALIVVHLFAAVFYAALLAGLAFGRDRAPMLPAVLRSAWVAVPAFGLPMALLLLLAPAVPGGHAPDGVYDIWAGYRPLAKLGTLLTAVATYDLAVDLLFAVAAGAAVSLVALRRAGQAHRGLLAAASGLLVLAVATPSPFGGTLFVDWRFPIMALLAAAAGLRPSAKAAAWARAGACALLLLALARSAWVGDVWLRRQADFAALQRALAAVPPGSAVLSVFHRPAIGVAQPPGRKIALGVPLHLQLAAFAVPWRSAFVPTLFTAPGKQPLRVLAPWNTLSVLEGAAAEVHLLEASIVSPQCSYHLQYLADWRERFDYVLLLNGDLPHSGGDAPSLRWLELLSDEGFARLYRIPRGRGDAPAAGAGPGGAAFVC